MDEQPVVVFISTDLIFYSKISTAAKQAGLHSQMLKSVELISQKVDPQSVKWVIIDLFQSNAPDIESTAHGVKELCPEAHLIAFGPHVDTDRLAAARAAGLDSVMTRGQLNRELPSMFVQQEL